MDEKVYFYHAYEENGFLSNFYPCVFIEDGYMWSSAEHYYQAQKFEDKYYKYWIMHAPTPYDAFKATRIVRPECIRSDWKNINVDVMRKAVRLKFNHNEKLRCMMLDFGRDAVFVENSPTDYFWGIGSEGTGKNMLGVILTEYKNDMIDLHSGNKTF